MSILNAKKGEIEIGDDSLIHPGLPWTLMTLPLAGGVKYEEGTVLQMNDDSKLTTGDLTKRSYIAVREVASDDDVALVLPLGAARTEKLLIATVSEGVVTSTPITQAEAITLMEKTPIACI